MHDDDTGCGCCGDEGPYFFDEQGDLVEDWGEGADWSAPTPPHLAAGLRERVRPETARPVLRQRSCGLPVLKGSWLIELTSRVREPAVARRSIRGPMRIEVQERALRISGDIYVHSLPDPRTERSMLTRVVHDGDGSADDPTYPQLPPNQYSWYFRSTGVSYASGVLSFGLRRHLWDRTSQDFVSEDAGSMRLTCRRSILARSGSAAVLNGTATIGGRLYDVRATRTSTMYRGCAVEVDVMTGRSWPQSAMHQGVARTFRDVFATSGWDVSVRVDELGVPDDASLSMAELQTLLTTHRAPGSGDPWRLWLLVGSAQGGLFGVMFDDDSVPREGAVGFADATLGDQSFIEPSARNQPLDAVPAAFLRTLVHEAGHALNLFHPKHDTHNPPIGTEIMNQTGDVMGFASATDTYPGNATFAFAPHDHDSLVHAPDPQVRPGWKNFGWGHGSLSAGVPIPADAAGLQVGDDAEDLALTIDLPTDTFVGEFVTASVTLTNTGAEPRTVTGRLNLAEGYLRFHHVLPDGAVEQVRDVIVACGPRAVTELAPGESMTARMQVFFTSEGVTFEQPGTHVVRAEFVADTLTTVRSNRVRVHVRTAATETEVDIAEQTMDAGVGRAFALGDFGSDLDARARLVTVAEAHHDVDTGGAAALVLANSLARTHTDYRRSARRSGGGSDGSGDHPTDDAAPGAEDVTAGADDVGAGAAAWGVDATREAAPDEAKHFLDLAMQGRTAEEMVHLAATVASPVEAGAPVVGAAMTRARRARKGKADLAAAEAIVADFGTAAPS
ncbi:hypothetical protein [Ornithinimicrobium cerasi]|uniref:hypothetical protein n=1 Tax=Ornithinimicrobium cerasi TaxID=2248773 RepID=UPI000EFE3AD2|nr:hypothetical protein [Ornithinimicrobium cerasi]